MYSKLVCGLALTVGAAHGAAHNLVRRDGAHGHSHGGGASSGYAAPAPAAPASGYNAPSSGYGAADPAPSGYDAPATGYAAEPSYDSGYGVSGYGEEGGFDIATLLIPILILAGLSLLFPTITTVSVRRKRHAEGKDMHTQDCPISWEDNK